MVLSRSKIKQNKKEMHPDMGNSKLPTHDLGGNSRRCSKKLRDLSRTTPAQVSWK